MAGASRRARARRALPIGRTRRPPRLLRSDEPRRRAPDEHLRSAHVPVQRDRRRRPPALPGRRRARRARLARARAGRRGQQRPRGARADPRARARTSRCVDLRLPEIDGIGIANAVTRDGLPTRVLLLSAFADDELVYRALEAGAAGYLTKDATQEEIARAIHGVAQRPHAARARARRRPREPDPRALRTATRRCSPSASARCSSCSARASRRRRSPPARTSARRRSSRTSAGLYEKLGVSDRAAAVAEAMRRGIVE